MSKLGVTFFDLLSVETPADFEAVLGFQGVVINKVHVTLDRCHSCQSKMTYISRIDYSKDTPKGIRYLDGMRSCAGPGEKLPFDYHTQVSRAPREFHTREVISCPNCLESQESPSEASKAPAT